MPHKKPKSKDIRTFLMKTGDPGSSRSYSSPSEQPGGAKGSEPGGAKGSEPGGAKGSEPGGADFQTGLYNEVKVKKENNSESETGLCDEVKVKKENNGESEEGHSHRFTVKFSRCPRYEYPIDCDRPRTVLQAVKLCEKYNAIIRHSDPQIMLQIGKGQQHIVATHFPCSCISDDEFVILSCHKSNVEKTQSYNNQTVQPRDSYSVFYINTRRKNVFRNEAVKKFSFLVVYGEKEMTVEEALKRDGRFVDELGDFHLSDYDNSKSIFERMRKVKHLHGKKFRIHPQKNKRANNDKQQGKAGTSVSAQQSCDPVLDVGKQTGISVRKAVEKSSSDADREEIYEKLRQQFPRLKELMESRFPADSYQEILNQRKESEFGKIQQSFSEVHRLKKMFKLGESVCKVVVKDVCEGTGFVLFDNYILTNGHLFKDFKDYVKDGRLQPDIDVFVLFNYEEPEPVVDYFYFKLARSYIWYGEDDLDYAVLELNPEGQKPNQTIQTKKMKVPPGLLKNFGPLPESGEACIIGHPAGGVKKVDPICIIEKERRGQAVDDHISKFKEFIVHTINDLKKQGIDNIMVGGRRADEVSTYDTFMYHGSSGSPVFDARGRLFGLHTAGYKYEVNKKEESAIEFAQPLLTIFKHFVNKMEERGVEHLLKKIRKEAESNSYLQMVLDLHTADTDELCDSSVPMDVD